MRGGRPRVTASSDQISVPFVRYRQSCIVVVFKRIGPARAESEIAHVHESCVSNRTCAVNGEGSSRAAVALAREVLRSPQAQLCRACTDLIGVAGAGITLMAGTHSGPISVSTGPYATLEDAQYTTGEGPCQDAFRLRTAVQVARLDQVVARRWPFFVEVARRNGVGAVFAYPLTSANANVGVLTLYQEAEGDLTTIQHEDSLSIAEVVTDTVVSLQAVAEAGELGEGLDVDYRAEIHQASGIIAVQLQIHPDEALIRLRGYAFATDEPLAAIATQVLHGQLRLPDDRDESDRND